jgi:hypothetical protein
VAPSLTSFQCNLDREIIEETCCCDYSDAKVVNTKNEDIIPVSFVPKSAPVGTGACDFCPKGYFSDAIVSFSSDDSVSCEGLMDLVQSGLPQSFCQDERTVIEDTCCPASTAVDGSTTEVRLDSVEGRLDESIYGGGDPDTATCDFCVGQQFLNWPIINFSSGNDSVSCRGLLDLVQSGLSPLFCESERTYIEEACCTEIVPTAKPTPFPTSQPSEDPTGSPTATGSSVPTSMPVPAVSLTTSPTPESEAKTVDVIPTEDDEGDVITDDAFDDDFGFGNSTSTSESVIVAEELDVVEEEAPATIKDGGKRQQAPLGSVERERKPTTDTTTGRLSIEGRAKAYEGSITHRGDTVVSF